MRTGEAAVAALVGMIAGAMGHNALGVLISAPWWVMAAVAALFAIALFCICRGRTSVRPVVLAAAAGLAAGLTLNTAVPPPRSSVITRAPVRLNAFESSPPEANEDLFATLDILDEHPQSLLGRRITVSGSWQPRLRDAFASVSRRVMACCAADAVDVGFDVLPAHPIAAAAGASVRVCGVVQASLHDGETRYVLIDADVELVSAKSSGGK